MFKLMGKKVITTFTLKNFVYLDLCIIGLDKHNFSA